MPGKGGGYSGRSAKARMAACLKSGCRDVAQKSCSRHRSFVYTVKVEPKTVNAGRNGKGMRELVGEGG
jgi:hypothetical protein